MAIRKKYSGHRTIPALNKILFGRIQHTMDEILVKRTAGKIAIFLSRVVAIVTWWLPSLFPGDQVAPQSDPPSTTDGIYPPSHHAPGSPSPPPSIRCKGWQNPCHRSRRRCGAPVSLATYSRVKTGSIIDQRPSIHHIAPHQDHRHHHNSSCALVVANSKPRRASQSVVAGVRIRYTPH